MNYSIPVNNLIDNAEYREKKNLLNKNDFEDILTQQLLISQLANGITYKDTDDMDEYERIFILKKLIALKKEELDAKKEAMKNIGK